MASSCQFLEKFGVHVRKEERCGPASPKGKEVEQQSFETGRVASAGCLANIIVLNGDATRVAHVG